MLDFMKDQNKRELTKRVRVCNRCGFIWHSKEDLTEETPYVLGRNVCPDCHGIDTQLSTPWHKANLREIRKRREHYLKSLGKQ